MALYCYFKAKPKKKRLSLLPGVFLLVGIVIIFNVTLPLFSYQLKSQENFQKKFLSPVNENKFQVLGQEDSLDYNQPQSWFPTAPNLPTKLTKITHYSISIPKLKIKDAVVEIGGEDLRKSLVQYQGTALPGQYGNPVIFGHSTLPQFFNPKNYHSIFSTLPTLKKGDEVLIDFDGISYRYKVVQMVEIEPTDISILSQYYDNQYLTLVTCVPPGTLFKRLVVRAKLV